MNPPPLLFHRDWKEKIMSVSQAVYDMCKAAQRDIIIESICLLRKAGGKSGEFRRKE